VATAGLITASMFVFEAAEHHLWANLLLGALIVVACAVPLLGEAPDTVAEPQVAAAPTEEGATLAVLLDQVPIPLLSYHADSGLRVLNRAARVLFRTDDLVTAALPELSEAVAGEDPGAAKILRLFDRAYAVGVCEVRTAGKTLRLASLADVQSEVRIAEATALRDLLRVLSHEIMNSLTPVASLAGIARKHLEGETSDGAAGAREALDFLSQRAQGLVRFVEAYRSLARLPDPVPRPVRLEGLLRDVVRVFEQSPVAREVTIAMDLPPDIPLLDVDEALLAQALINVLTNAAEASLANDGARRIGVAVAREKDEVRIDIGDNGCGIPDDLRDNIFHAFVTTKATGTGTGLNLARQIALAHGGDLVLLQDGGPWNTVFSLILRAPSA